MMLSTIITPHAVAALRHVLPLALGFQIGPKIRIGGTLGKIGQTIKTDLGKVDKAVAPVVSFIPGIGTIAAPLLNTMGNVLDTTNGGIKNWSDVGNIALTDALEALPGATGLSTKLAGGATGLSALPAELKNLLGGANGLLTKIPGVSGIENLVTGGGAGASGAGGTGSGGGGILGGIEGLLQKTGILGGGGNGGGGLDPFLLAASVADQAATKQRQQSLQDQGLTYAKDAYTSMAPVRSLGLSDLTNNAPPDLSSIFSDSANPFAKLHSAPTPTIGTKVPVPAPSTQAA